MTRINLMSGRKHLKGWTNVDMYEDEFRKPDIVSDVMELSFPEGSIDQIFWRHGVEHLWYDQSRIMLGRIRKWLKVGGVCDLENPDLDFTMRRYANDPNYPTRYWIYQIYGMQDRATGQVHYSGWTPYIMRDNLTKIGWFTDEIEIKTNEKGNMFTHLTKKR